MASTHSSIHLHPADAAPRAMLGGRDTVWVDLAGEYGLVQVFPASPEQSEALAIAFQQAADLQRSVPAIDVREEVPSRD